MDITSIHQWTERERLLASQMNQVDDAIVQLADGYNSLDVTTADHEARIIPLEAIDAESRLSLLESNTQNLIEWAHFNLTGSSVAYNAYYTPTYKSQPGSSFTISGTDITVPEPGFYEVRADLLLTCSSTTNPLTMQAQVVGDTCYAIRWSASAAQPFTLHGAGVISIADPSSTKLTVRQTQSGSTATLSSGSRLLVRRLSPLAP